MDKLKILINVLLSFIYNKISRIVCHVKEDWIVFQGKPEYSDNPRALSDYLVGKGHDCKYKIFWLVKNASSFEKKHPGTNVKFIQLKNKSGLVNWKAYKILVTAKYVFASHGFNIAKEQGLQGQNYVTLWHGCGYKENAGSQLNRFFDLALVPGPIFVKTKSHFWHTSEQYFIAKGYPRYDWLLYPSEKANRMMEKWRQNANKVVIWMPTYRNSKVSGAYKENIITQFPLMATDADWDALDAICRKTSVRLLVKLHMSQKKYDIDFSRFSNIVQISNNDFEEAGIQMYEFIALTDGLISDYSSIAIDYLLVDKPIAFALDDFETYKDVRGFVFENPKEYMPGHHLYTQEDLYGYLSDVAEGKDLFRQKRKEISNMAIYHSKNYCKEIADALNL